MKCLPSLRAGMATSVPFLLALVFAPSVSQAQTGSLVGRAVVAGTDDPVPGAEVTVLSPTLRRAAVTRADGRYAIAGLPAGTYTVEVRRIGFGARTVPDVVVGSESVTLDLTLSPISLRLEEIVVTGVTDPTAGVKVPFTVGRVNADEMPVASGNAVDNLQGKIAGVTIVTSPQPGTGTNIMLRSPTSISKSNSPLFVVDGVVLSSAFGASTADIGGLDIESIEVVKGAAAASLYGSRASSGVIQIRTRRGRDVAGDRTRVVLRSEFGSSSISRPVEFASHHIYQTNAAGEYVNANGEVVPREQRILKPAATRYQDTPFRQPFDHMKAFFDPGTFATTTLSVAQNTGTTNFFASASREQQDGVVLGAGAYERLDARFNLDHRPGRTVEIATSLYHMRSHRDDIYGNAFVDLAQQAPDVDLRVPDPDGTPFAFQPDPIGVRPNPLYILATEDNWTKRTRTLGSAEVRWSPLDWINLAGNVSYDRSDRLIHEYLARGLQTLGSGNSIGQLRRGDGATQSVNAALNANLLRRMGDLTVRASLRGLMERETADFFEATGSDFAVNAVPDLDAARVATIGQTFSEIRANSVIGSAGIDWKEKLIVDGLVRRDGTSLFGPEESHATYYRVSGAYRLTEEPWWPWRQVDEFKLRVSQGTAGGRPSFADQYETYSIGTGGILSKSTLGNRALKPETARETEFGVDVIAWNRISMQLSYARTKVTDQLLLVPLPAVFGFTSQWRNAGTIEGNTLEATLQAQVLNRQNTSLVLGAVFDRSRNTITEFDLPCFRTQTIGFRCVGEALGTMYGHQFVRSPGQLPAVHDGSKDQFQVNDDGWLVPVGSGASYTDQQWGTTVVIDGVSYPWGIPFRALDDAGQPRVANIGTGNPDYNLGFNATLRHRGFTVYGLLGAQIGGDVYNSTKQRMFQNHRSAEQDQDGKPDELKKPELYYTTFYNANSTNNFFVEDATFLKLRELSVTYRVNAAAVAPLRRLGIQGMTASLVGRNLLVFTGYTGYDPEIGSVTNRLDSFDYPQYRTITGSLTIEF